MNQAELNKVYDQPLPFGTDNALMHETLQAAIKGLAELFNSLITNKWTDEDGMFHERLQEVSYWGHAHIIRNE